MSKDEKVENVKEEKKDKWQLGQVATETADVIYNAETEEQLSANQALVKILNELDVIKKTLN